MLVRDKPRVNLRCWDSILHELGNLRSANLAWAENFLRHAAKGTPLTQPALVV